MGAFSRQQLDQIIADAAAQPIPELTRRDIQVRPLKNKASMLVGMRRTGKTSLMWQKVTELLSDGVPRSHIALFNFDNLAFDGMDGADLLGLVDAWYKRYPEAERSTLHLFADEIQLVARWEKALRQLIETPRIQVMATGSSAKLLSTEIATNLRGRSLSTEVWPFSLAESWRHLNYPMAPATRWPLSARSRGILERTFSHYLEAGGFPEVQGVDVLTRRRILSEYVDLTLTRDIIERHQVSNVPALRAFVRQLLRASGRKVSINKMTNDLTSQGVSVGKNMLHAFAAYVEDAYFFFFVPIFSASARKQQANPKKCYCIDSGMIRASTYALHIDLGLVLETAAFIELRRRGLSPAYVITDKGREVDFAVEHAGEMELIQVCWSLLEDDATKNRELTSLFEAAERWPQAKLRVITAYESGTETNGKRRASIVPYYEWVLRQTGLTAIPNG
jgi:predicted AAA+ superfamily ATPase